MRGAEDEAAQVEEQLRALDTRAMQVQGSQRIYGMSHINKRNQTINFNTAFRNVSNVPQGAGGSNAVKGGSDPFSRRATRPAIYWRTGQVRGGQGRGACAKGGSDPLSRRATRSTFYW